MKINTILSGGLAIALAVPVAALAQQAGHGDAGPASQGGMMSPEMHEQMHEQMREMMRPMMRDMMREMMAEPQEGEAPDAPADAAAGVDHDAHHTADGAAPAGSPANEAYRAANLAMHEAMDIDFTGDADIDFARGMIGHHQGAIDMARIVLEHGEDPELRQLAEEVIEAQEAEIEFLRAWIAEREG
jgi:uncharacterized protein (DUF305 family)